MTNPLGTTSVSWGALKKTAEDATKPLPVDWYDMVVVKAEFKTASTGNLMIAAQLEVIAGPSKTRRVFTNFVLAVDNGFALSLFFRRMAAFGLDDAFFTTLEQYAPEQGMSIIAQSLVNRAARVKVGIRQWQGQDRNDCEEFAPLAQTGPQAPGIVTGPAHVAGSPAVSSSPVSPTGPTISVTPTTPTTPTTSVTPTTTPSVPGPPPPPEPAF